MLFLTATRNCLERQIVPTGDLLLHEELDRGRTARLTHRVAEDKILRNPSIVARMEGSSSHYTFRIGGISGVVRLVA
jgi:hypothetical protein